MPQYIQYIWSLKLLNHSFVHGVGILFHIVRKYTSYYTIISWTYSHHIILVYNDTYITNTYIQYYSLSPILHNPYNQTYSYLITSGFLSITAAPCPPVLEMWPGDPSFKDGFAQGPPKPGIPWQLPKGEVLEKKMHDVCQWTISYYITYKFMYIYTYTYHHSIYVVCILH